MKPVYYPAADFGFDRSRVSAAALDVAQGLQDAGYDGYLVGGCVRDLLLGMTPKDFDVTTNATPEQVRKVFRRARIIGRRFRLVHVRYGREVIEVATYRAAPQGAKKNGWLPWNGRGKKSGSGPRTTEDGRLLDDNVYGTLEDDALRRDFTINALYYDPVEEQLVDFLGGVRDIDARCIRLIGKPAERFAEDPVRMLRVLRFKAKLDLEPERGLMKAVHKQRELLAGVPSARLFDEVLKLFHHAHGVASWRELRENGFSAILFPRTEACLEGPDGETMESMIVSALENTDRRISQDKPVIPAYLFAVLLWRPFQDRLGVSGDEIVHNERIWQAGDAVFAEQCRQVAVPRRVSSPAIEIWHMQFNLERRRPKSIEPLLASKRFRAAYDFLALRASIGEVPQETVDWWTRIQDLDADGRRQMVQQMSGGGGNEGGGPKRRRRRPRRRPRGARPAADRGAG